MIKELHFFNSILLKSQGIPMTNLTKEEECADYLGYNFQLGKYNFKFRKAKTTHKKIGLFVTLWKRNKDGFTEPFHTTDNFEFVVVFTAQEDNVGFFLFPKQILANNKVVSSSKTTGKRGFRVYPNWVQPQNKQATKTQSWQKEYFIPITTNESFAIEKFNAIYNSFLNDYCPELHTV